MLTYNELLDLAKRGNRLDSTNQWILADELSKMTEADVDGLAIKAGRNASTLKQYARAAARWPFVERVEGVSFSAHRVALSHPDPRQLLEDLKAKHGSPTVKQVREALGLEGHPALEAARKLLKYQGQDVLTIPQLIALINELQLWVNTLTALASNATTPQATAAPQETTYENPDNHSHNYCECEDPGCMTQCDICWQANDRPYVGADHCGCDDCYNADEDAREKHRARLKGDDTDTEPIETEEEEEKEVWTLPTRMSDIVGI